MTKVIQKAVSICVIIQQNFHNSQYGSKFRAQQYRDKLSKTLERLEEKKAVHTSCRHGVRRIVNFIPKNDPRTLETIWIIVNETRNKDLAPKTLDELKQ